jgi:hypothetical protein
MEAKKLKLDEIQDTFEELIQFLSESYPEHTSISMIIHNLRGAADGVHKIRFDNAVSSKFIEENKEGK